MFNLVLFSMAVIGLTCVLVESSIFMPFREWVKNQKGQLWCFIDKILGCHQCCGVWCGWFCGLCLFAHWPMTLTNFLVVFMSGFAGSFLASSYAAYYYYLSTQSVADLPSPSEDHE